jgi:hypothetical protein
MEKTSFRISKESKDILERLKTKFNYKTYDDCVINICLFMENNFLNPKEPYIKSDYQRYSEDLRMYFDDLRKFQRDDSQSLRKFLGALEKTYLKPLINKLEIKDVLQAVDLSKPATPEPAPNLDDLLPKKTSTVSAENLAEIDRLKVRISELNRANKEALDNADNCKNVLKEFVSKIKIVRSIVSGNEICEIDMKKDEFFKLKERAGVI